MSRYRSLTQAEIVNRTFSDHFRIKIDFRMDRDEAQALRAEINSLLIHRFGTRSGKIAELKVLDRPTDHEW